MNRSVTGKPAASALGIETVGMSVRFGAFTALDKVSVVVRPGSFHALLGENGAGKSTLVKCIMGYYHADEGQLLVGGREVDVPDPRAAHTLGLGMVYQHFTLVPSLTAAENLVISRDDAPPIIAWRRERRALAAFMDSMPFTVPLDARVDRLSAGEKQKLEILKQLYLGRRLLILDEPTSVLTPTEADEVLGLIRGLTASGRITVLMITHKFREVSVFADTVSVLRRGVHVGTVPVADVSHAELAALMVGGEIEAPRTLRSGTPGKIVLSMSQVRAPDRSGRGAIAIEGMDVRAGEVVGIAGVSGNGQMELMEILTGQRPLDSGSIRVRGESWSATRAEARTQAVRYLPEEPLYNACAPRMSVAENLAFRSFDVNGGQKPRFWIDPQAIARHARMLIGHFKVRAASIDSPIESLSGGNVQRVVLARELTGNIELLVISNPCFGLDFAAVAEIRARIVEARNAGTAVLLMSEDLDEILELADRVLVISEGRIAFETPIVDANVAEIGRYMAGHG